MSFFRKLEKQSAQLLYQHEKELEVIKKDQEEQKNRIEKIEEAVNPTKLLTPVKSKYLKLLALVHGLTKDSPGTTHSSIWDKLETDLNKKFSINIQQELEKMKESHKQYYYNKCKEYGGAKFVPKTIMRPFEIKNLSLNKIISAKPEWFAEALSFLGSSK